MANKISSYESNGWMAVATYQNLTSIIGKLNDPTYVNILNKGDRHLPPHTPFSNDSFLILN